MLLSSGEGAKGACCKVVCVANLWLDLACLVVLVLCRHSWGIPFSKLRLVCLCRLPGLPLLPSPPPLSACHCLCHVACLAGLLPCVLLIADPVVLVLVVLLVVAVALVDFLALFTFILLLLVLLLLPPVWAIFLS